jgi:hypothetical protein
MNRNYHLAPSLEWPRGSWISNQVADPKLREKRLAAQIFKPKGLLATELAAQTSLPFKCRKIGGRMGA